MVELFRVGSFLALFCGLLVVVEGLRVLLILVKVDFVLGIFLTTFGGFTVLWEETSLMGTDSFGIVMAWSVILP